MSFLIALLLGLAGLAVPGSLHAQEAIPGTQPVPPEYLRGTTLTVPDLDFSVEAPGPTWRWSRSSSASGSITQTIFFCHEPETDVRHIVSVLPLEGSFDGRTMEQFLRGLAASIEKNGRTVLDARHETATLPRPGSFRYRYTARGPGGPSVYGVGYVVPGDRLYVLQAASATPLTSPSRSGASCARSGC